jgi:hypothetical protein
VIAGHRKYSSGTRWCVWRWTDVVIGQLLYLRRLHLLQAPWGAVMLHWIYRPDPQPDLHDHPVDFVSIVLRGGYDEWRPRPAEDFSCVGFMGPLGLYRKRRFSYVRATGRHRISHVRPGTLTLCFAGPVRRQWGFWTVNGWVPWREYERRS